MKILLLILTLSIFVNAENRISIRGHIASSGIFMSFQRITVTADIISSGGGTATVTANPFGYYAFHNLEGGNTYRVTPVMPKGSVAFKPESYIVLGTQNEINRDFTYSLTSLCRRSPCYW